MLCRCGCQRIRWPSGRGWRCLICDTAPGPLFPLRRI